MRSSVHLSEDAPLHFDFLVLDDQGKPVRTGMQEAPGDGDLRMPYAQRGPDEAPSSSPFCNINTKINDWAWVNSTHWALTFAFVICSIKAKWPELIVGYPSFVMFVLNNFTRQPLPASIQEAYSKVVRGSNFAWNTDEFSYEDVSKDPMVAPWARLFANGKDRWMAISLVWNNRDQLFEQALKHKQTHDAVAKQPEVQRVTALGMMHPELAMAIGNVQNFYETIRGLGTAKAGFMTQLTIGRSACMDSNNIAIYKDEMEANKEKWSALMKDPPKTEKNRRAYFANYNHFLDAVSGTTNESEFFWDNWVRLIAMKLNYAGEKQGTSGRDLRKIWIGTAVGKDVQYKWIDATTVYQYIQNPSEDNPNTPTLPSSLSKYLEVSKVASRRDVTPEIVSNQHLIPLIVGAVQLGLNPASTADVVKAMDTKFESRKPMVTESLLHTALQYLDTL